MLHVVPILCILGFIFLVEYRFKQHLDVIDEKIKTLEKYHEGDHKCSKCKECTDECCCSK